MKTKPKPTTVLGLILAFSCLQPSSSPAQGSLTPPGAPAPTMKSLDQVEARTAITTAGAVTISESGSYYLTRNLTVSSGNGITISTHGVTLDLNGFTISSTAPSATGTGILLTSGLRDITIHNGHIRGGVTNNGSGVYGGSGFGNGIAPDGPLQNVLISRVSVSGCLNDGINIGANDPVLVETCMVRTVGGFGIIASTIKTSWAKDCGYHAIYGQQVSDCRGESSGSGYGVSAFTALNCYGYSTSGIGVFTFTALNCYGFSNSSYGVIAEGTAIGCYGSSSTGVGLYALNASTCTASRPGGTAIQATVANGCYAAAGSNVITHKYNMP
jgi:hypothetical protein